MDATQAGATTSFAWGRGRGYKIQCLVLLCANKSNHNLRKTESAQKLRFHFSNTCILCGNQNAGPTSHTPKLWCAYFVIAIVLVFSTPTCNCKQNSNDRTIPLELIAYERYNDCPGLANKHKLPQWKYFKKLYSTILMASSLPRLGYGWWRGRGRGSDRREMSPHFGMRRWIDPIATSPDSGLRRTGGLRWGDNQMAFVVCITQLPALVTTMERNRPAQPYENVSPDRCWLGIQLAGGICAHDYVRFYCFWNYIW